MCSRIINSFEKYKIGHIIEDIDEKDFYQYENRYEIENNCKIMINDKYIDFDYLYRFEEKGKYTIKYILNNNLSKADFLFAEFLSITKIDLSNFNTQNITNMDHMFL